MGWFTREEIRTRHAPVRKSAGLTTAELHEIGLKGVENMNPAAKTRHMLPTGDKNPEIIVLGDHPSKVDDELGRPFVSHSGKYLRSLLPDNCRMQFDNVVRTLPVKRKKGYKPTPHEIGAYFTTVSKNVSASAPKIILALGDVATLWGIGDIPKATIHTTRGRRFPVSISGHTCWLYSAQHPATILALLDSEEYAKIPGSEHEIYFKKDIAQIFEDLESGLPQPTVFNPKEIDKEITVELHDAGKIKAFLEKCVTVGEPIGIDIETNKWRPYSDQAKILTVAVSASFGTISFPLDHPLSPMPEKDRKTVWAAFKKFLLSPLVKIAHSTTFEVEWLVHFCGDDLAFCCNWADTMAQAYILDEREGGKSLDFLCILHYGLKLKDFSTGWRLNVWGLEIEEDIDRNQLERTDVFSVCKYNARDAKFTRMLYFTQKELLLDQHSWEVYKSFVARVIPIVFTQRQGLPTNEKITIEFQEKEGAEIERIEKQIKALPCISTFEKRYGAYKDSHPNNVKLFWNILERKEVRFGENKFSTKEEVLETIDLPIAKLLLELRGHKKLKSTYIDRLRSNHPETRIFPDGKIHPTFNHCRVDTGRLSSDVQQWPKRNDKWVRKQIQVPAGYVMLCCDMGQLEYRGLGMVSGDKVIIDSLFNDFDVHGHWARRIAQAYPKVVIDRHGDLSEKSIKLFRGELKTDLVFPAFYRAKIGLAARALDGMPINKLQPIWDEFWEMFKGVLDWQNREISFYQENGYIETLSGRRRHGPMSETQICNSSVQGSSSDIVVRAWELINEYAYQNQIDYLYAFAQIHDDCSFIVPKNKVDEALSVIVPRMLNPGLEWVKVPLVVEANAGTDWAEQHEIGKFRSDCVVQDLAVFHALNG